MDTIPEENSVNNLQDFMKIILNKENKGINLSKINIPISDSKPENWRSFREIVQIMLDDASINSTRKLLALKQSTQGEAHRLIQNIRYGPAAERRAFSLLIKRFDNPRKMLNLELGRLINREKISDPIKNVKSLVDCSLTVFNNIEGIIREEEEGKSITENRVKKDFSPSEIKEIVADAVFIYNIEVKFDFATALAYEEFIERNDLSHVSIEYMQKFLENYAKKLEQSASQSKNTLSEKFDKNPIRNILKILLPFEKDRTDSDLCRRK